MQISSLTAYSQYKQSASFSESVSNKKNNHFQETEKQPSQKFYSKNLGILGVNFKGIDDNKTLEKLTDEYTWYVNVDNTKPLDAFLKIKTDKENMNKLFCRILEDDNLSYSLINDIAGRARDSKKNYSILRELLGDNSDSLRFFLPNNPYGKAFEKYMSKRYEDAKSIESLLKLRPDWRESALIDKYEQLNGNRSLKIGNLPDEFKNGVFEQIYNHLKSYCQYNGFKIKNDIPALKIGNREYNFEYFTEGKTDKNVFGVYTPEKKYVFKMAEEDKKSLNKPFSLGVLALIDSYLTLNECRNIAPLYYYDHDKNTCIYKYQDHNQVHQALSSPAEVNCFMPDFEALGMCYSDTIGHDNYFLSDKDCQPSSLMQMSLTSYPTKELISVDNDHVTFSSPFMLLVTKYNAPLPNAMQTAF